MSLFSRRTPKHKTFDYKPRHWDPEQEEREERRRHRELMRDQSVEGTKERIRSGFVTGRGGTSSHRYRNQQIRRSSMTFIIVAAALILLSFMAIRIWLPKLETWLS